METIGMSASTLTAIMAAALMVAVICFIVYDVHHTNKTYRTAIPVYSRRLSNASRDRCPNEGKRKKQAELLNNAKRMFSVYGKAFKVQRDD
jgi:hypothetical protein